MSAHSRSDPAARPAGPDRQGRLTVPVLGVLSGFGPLSMDMYLPALPKIGEDLQASPTQVQLTLSACFVGLALGQAVAGPVSDQLGRRGPLLAGLVAFVASSLGCAFAPSIWVLIVLRLLQGVAGATGLVVSRSIVRDRYPDDGAARMFSLLMVVQGAVPILAPLVGGGILEVLPWRALFLVLAGVGSAIWMLVLFVLPESLPVPMRHRGGLRAMGSRARLVVGDRLFVGAACVLVVTGISLYTYIALSSFIFQHEFGLGAAMFSVFFAVNSVGIMVAGRLSAALSSRFGSVELLGGALAVMCVAAVVLLLVSLAGWGLAATLAPLFFVIAPVGVILPNSTAVALSRHRAAAGTASAVLGVVQYAVGAAAGPVVSLGGVSALAMSVAMATAGVGALTLLVTVVMPAGR